MLLLTNHKACESQVNKWRNFFEDHFKVELVTQKGYISVKHGRKIGLFICSTGIIPKSNYLWLNKYVSSWIIIHLTKYSDEAEDKQ